MRFTPFLSLSRFSYRPNAGLGVWNHTQGIHTGNSYAMKDGRAGAKYIRPRHRFNSSAEPCVEIPPQRHPPLQQIGWVTD